MRSEWRSEGNSSMISRARVRAHAEGVRLIASFEASCQDFFRHHPVGLRFSTSSAGSEAQHAKDDDALRLKPDLPSLHGERHPGIEHLSVLSNSLGGKPHCGTLVPLLSLCLRHRSFLRHVKGRAVKTSTLVAACAGLVVAWTAASSAEPQPASPADGKAMIERASRRSRRTKRLPLRLSMMRRTRNSAIAICMSTALVCPMGISPPTNAQS